MKRFRRVSYILSVLVLTLLFSNTSARADAPGKKSAPNTPIQHFIVLMQENHTFDNYFGTYPGADGIPAGICMPVDPFDSANKDCVQSYHIGDRPIDDLDHSLGTFEAQYND